MKRTIPYLLSIVLIFAVAKTSFSHCEVPCGIYNDELRVELLKEHFQTIEKAMKQIEKIQSAEVVNYNQLVRWINTKEEHANKIQEIAEQYFLTQRVKFADPADKEKYDKYITQLTSMHQLIVYAMKSKQTTDVANVEAMSKSLTTFEHSYFGEHRHNKDGTHK